MKIETLELASMALNAKVASMEKYPEGTSGYSLKLEYLAALYEINAEIHEASK